MQDSDIPAKFNHAWAYAAGGAFIRTVPDASQIGIQNGAASLHDGFPPNCFLPIASGGSWPWAQDFNGILNQITAWNRWTEAGGPIVWDSAFSAAIGGYPLGAVVGSATVAGRTWRSTTENNVTNPDTGGAGWINNQAVGGDLSGTLPNPTFNLGIAHTWTTIQTFNAGIFLPNNQGLISADTTGATHEMIAYDTSNNVTIVGGTVGFRVVNSGFTANNLALDNAGNLTIRGNTTVIGAILGQTLQAIANASIGTSLNVGTSLSAGTTINAGGGIAAGGAVTGLTVASNSGNVTANGGRLRASFGALFSGDPNAATILGDFATNSANFIQLPTGLTIQFFTGSAPRQATTTFNFPISFGSFAVCIVGIQQVINTTVLDVIVGGAAINTAQYQVTCETATPTGGNVGYNAVAIGM